MLFTLLSIYLLLNVHIVSSVETKRVLENMYIKFNRVGYCVRRMNGTHEVGCQSSSRGNSGHMHMIDSNQEFNSFLTDTKFIQSIGSFIIVMNINLFNEDHVDKLMASLDSRLNGILLYLKSNLTRPEYFSPDDQCPNHRQSFYLNQAETINWNPFGTGLFFRSFPFPIMLIDEEDDYKTLVKFYAQFNRNQTGPTCGLELSLFQQAAHSSKTCMRRNDINHLIIDEEKKFCDPVGGLNLYSKLPQSSTVSPKQRPAKSVVLILTATDGFQMFLKTNGVTGGAQQPATALITFLAFAHLIGQEQDSFNQQNKEIIFVTLDGDALDYSASYRFMYDMKNGYFPSNNQNEEPIRVEHIHSVIEFQSLSFTEKLSLYTYPPALINQTFIDALVRNNKMIVPMDSNSILPPASSQIFLKETSSTSFPAYILTSTNDSRLLNRYYHSYLDDLSTLDINVTSLEYNTTTNFSEWIKQIVEPLTQSLLESFVGVTKNVTIKQEIINNLVYCTLKNVNCSLIYELTNRTTGVAFNQSDGTALAFAIKTYPEASTNTFAYIRSILGYFLRDRTYDTYNFTEAKCNESAHADSLYSYTYVDGYRPSISNEQVFTGYCVRSYIRSASSISPAFAIDNYDLADTRYPAWTESRWTTISLRLFVIPTRQHEIVTLVIGILLLLISFFACLILRFYTNISLLQPSSS